MLCFDPQRRERDQLLRRELVGDAWTLLREQAHGETLMEKWTELRTTYKVAQLGTVAAAARELGVHRATVNRHIDALEAELGAKIFQRHSRGYVLTELGQDVLNVATAANEQLRQLEGKVRIRSASATGELILTSAEFFSSLIMTTLHQLLHENPSLRFRYVASRELLKLEYGEAHVAIRTGPQPIEPDNVVQPFMKIASGLYAHASYVEQYGRPQSEDEFKHHYFVCCEPSGLRPDFLDWLRVRVPADRILLASNSSSVQFQAICAGVGIGFFPQCFAKQKPDLLEIMPPRKLWEVDTWLVTHVDLHRTEKVQTCLRLLKAAVERE